MLFAALAALLVASAAMLGGIAIVLAQRGRKAARP